MNIYDLIFEFWFFKIDFWLLSQWSIQYAVAFYVIDSPKKFKDFGTGTSTPYEVTCQP